jgi:hypothetical protein
MRYETNRDLAGAAKRSLQLRAHMVAADDYGGHTAR